MTRYSLDEIEAFGRDWTDTFAARQGWQEHHLTDPVEDLALFFTNIPGATVLDSGCGWGRYVFRFIDEGLTYCGLDHSEEMLKAARETNPGAFFMHHSFRKIPFSDNYFAGIWSCCSLSAIPKAHLTQVLREHRRVLRKGGVMMIVMPAPGTSDEVMYTDNDGTPEMLQAHYHLVEFEGYVKEAGFQIVESGYRHGSGSMFVLSKKSDLQPNAALA